VCAAVIVVRIAWVMSHTMVDRWRIRRFGMRLPRQMSPPTLRTGILASWCGMRGIVTLATALALPRDAFPHRDLIVFSAYCVVLVTLVVQGLTLRPLMQWLKLRDDGIVAREIDIARAETARAALRVLEPHDATTHSANTLRREYETRLKAAEACTPLEAAERSDDSLAVLQQRAIDAQREALTDLRARRVIGDDALHAVEEEIDLLELTADPRVRPTIERTS
jgi:CPA1 family monovalent cation:H+ antiporter